MGDTIDVRDGTHSSPKFYTNGYPLVTSKNLKEFGIDMSDVSLISHRDFELINQRSKVDIGDILFGMIGTIGNPVLVEQTGFAIKNVALLKSSSTIANTFLVQLLKSYIFDTYIQKENSGGTQKFLGLNQIRNFKFFSPVLCEQQKIGSFFKYLDELITLHQRRKIIVVKNEVIGS